MARAIRSAICIVKSTVKNTIETRLGIFIAVAVLALFILLEVVGGIHPFQRGYRLHGLFPNVEDLKVGDSVKMAGVSIGKVQSIVLTNEQVRVTFWIRHGVPVRTDSMAIIRLTGLAGRHYVNIDFGSEKGVPAVDGAYLSVGSQPDLNALFAKLYNVAEGAENFTKSFTGDKIENLFGPATDLLKQNDSSLTSLIGNLKITSDRLVTEHGTFGLLISEDGLYNVSLATVTNLQAISSDAKTLIVQARVVLQMATNILAEVRAGRGTAGMLVTDEKLYAETEAAMSNLRQILDRINHGNGAVGELINDASLVRDVTLSLHKLDIATESLEDTGALSLIGTAAKSLFKGPKLKP